MSCGESCSCSSDLELLWLWCRPVATALILPLAWEPPYTVGAALKKKKKKKKKIEKKNWKKQNQTKKISSYHTFPFSYLPLIHFDQKLSHQAPETILFKIINNFHLANFNGQFSDSLKIPTAVDTVSFPFLFFFFFFLLCFLGMHLWPMEVPRLRVKSELQLPAYATTTEMRDPKHIGNLYHSSWWCQIPDPLSEARDQTTSLWILVRFVSPAPHGNSPSPS